MRGSSVRRNLAVLASFLLVAIVANWPLPLHLRTHVTGPPGGDTGVYIWNLWVFRHELLSGHSPFTTDTILPLTGRVDLSLHNHTVFADLLSLPLQTSLGVVETFNIVYLINVALCGWGLFVLARKVSGGVAEAWLAALFFACCPFLVARGAAHFSLAAAAPLPFFLFWLITAWETRRARDAAFTGVMMAWAAYSDPYYAVYCALFVVAWFVHAIATVHVTGWTRPTMVRRVIDGLIVAVAAAVATVGITGGRQVSIGPLAISVKSFYTPVLGLSVLIVLRIFLTWRPRVTLVAIPAWRSLTTVHVVMAATAAVLMAPELYAVAVRVSDGRMVHAPVLWRSSAPGLDVVEYLVPNPNHPLAPASLVSWISRQPGRYEENVAALSFIGLAVLVVAARVARWRPARFWLMLTLGFLSLSLGPFIQVAGVHTYIPTPWTFLRYVPLISEARMPPRFAVIVALGFAMLLASALRALSTHKGAQGRALLAGVGLAMSVELLAAPRPLFSAAVPKVYQRIAADPRPVRVLEVPFGVRDGLSSLGDFSAASQLYQTVHGKPLLGGYLSRVDDASKAAIEREPALRVLLTISERHAPSEAELDEARGSAEGLVDRAQIGYIVIDSGRVSPDARAFIVDAFHATPLEADGPVELFATRLR